MGAFAGIINAVAFLQDDILPVEMDDHPSLQDISAFFTFMCDALIIAGIFHVGSKGDPYEVDLVPVLRR